MLSEEQVMTRKTPLEKPHEKLAVGVIRFSISIVCWVIGLTLIITAIDSILPGTFIVAVFFFFLGYLMWPNKP
jgi:hypothetical protein|tara:strand:+ start:273 stop:491 length:219 start_codon:yes stop_codon:yes gene_type:complete